MSLLTTILPTAWQGREHPAPEATARVDRTGETGFQAVYGRALKMGRFRYGWSADQRAFLESEVALWSAARCCALGEEVAGITDRLVWELLPLEQAALCQFRVLLLDQLEAEETLSEPLQNALAQLKRRELAQQREYRQLAIAVQQVTDGRDREMHRAWFEDALLTRAASQWDAESMKVGLLALAQLFLRSPHA